VLLVEVLAGFLREQFPFAFCIPCLAIKFRASEREIRNAAQLLVATSAFGVNRRTCYDCRRIAEIVGKQQIRTQSSP
jgi:hypothetical protein